MGKLSFLSIIFSAFLITSCSKYEVRHTVQYFISGKSNMAVSYNDDSGKLIFLNNVSSEWKYAFNAPADKRIVTLIVNSVDGNPVGGAILIDGEEAAIDNSSTGTLSISTQLP